VGQGEVAVRSVVDFFLVLMIAGASDEMQGIKKGVIELADAIVINKADGDNRSRCVAAQAEMRGVLHDLHRATEGWETPALLASSLTLEGIPEVWRMAQDYFAGTRATGALDARRRTQAVEWMHALIAESLRRRFYTSPTVSARRDAHQFWVERAAATKQTGIVFYRRPQRKRRNDFCGQSLFGFRMLNRR